MASLNGSIAFEELASGEPLSQQGYEINFPRFGCVLLP